MCDDEMGFKVDGHLKHVGATDIYPNHTVPGRASKAINQYSVHITSNWQLSYLNQRYAGNDSRNGIMSTLAIYYLIY